MMNEQQQQDNSNRAEKTRPKVKKQPRNLKSHSAGTTVTTSIIDSEWNDGFHQEPPLLIESRLIICTLVLGYIFFLALSCVLMESGPSTLTFWAFQGVVLLCCQISCAVGVALVEIYCNEAELKGLVKRYPILFISLAHPFLTRGRDTRDATNNNNLDRIRYLELAISRHRASISARISSDYVSSPSKWRKCWCCSLRKLCVPASGKTLDVLEYLMGEWTSSVERGATSGLDYYIFFCLSNIPLRSRSGEEIGVCPRMEGDDYGGLEGVKTHGGEGDDDYDEVDDNVKDRDLVRLGKRGGLRFDLTLLIKCILALPLLFSAAGLIGLRRCCIMV